MSDRVHPLFDIGYLVIGFYCLVFGLMAGFCIGEYTTLSKYCEPIENRAAYVKCMKGE